MLEYMSRHEGPFDHLPGAWPVTVEHGNLVLRPFRARDRAEWEAVRRRNADWLTPWDATTPDPSSAPHSFRAMVRTLNRDAERGGGYPWLLCLRDDDAPVGSSPRIIGQLVVSHVARGAAQSASIGYWIDRDVAGRGLMPQAVAMAVDFLFTRAGLHRIEINIVPRNAPSHRVVDKLGFRHEGVRRNYLHINGAWEDHDAYALTREEVPAQGLLSHLGL